MLPPKCNKCGSVIICKDAVAVTRLRQHQASKECRALVMTKHLRERGFMPLKVALPADENERLARLGLEIVQAETRLLTTDAGVVQNGFKSRDNSVDFEVWAPIWYVLVREAFGDFELTRRVVLRGIEDADFCNAILTVHGLAPEGMHPITRKSLKAMAVFAFISENCS